MHLSRYMQMPRNGRLGSDVILTFQSFRPCWSNIRRHIMDALCLSIVFISSSFNYSDLDSAIDLRSLFAAASGVIPCATHTICNVNSETPNSAAYFRNSTLSSFPLFLVPVVEMDFGLEGLTESGL